METPILINNTHLFLYKNIFPTFAIFSEWLATAVYYQPIDSTYILQMYLALYRQYANSMILFDSVEEFKGCMANVLNEHMIEYYTIIERAKKIYALTDEDIEVVSTAINNRSDSPNEPVIDINAPLTYITDQAYGRAKSNKNEAFLNYLRNIPSIKISEFVKLFAWLFKKYAPRREAIFYES